MELSKKRVGIVSDGGTDYAIFSRLVECLLGDKAELEIFELNRQSLRDEVDRYWTAANRANCYYLPHQPAKDLQAAIVNLSIAAFSDFEGEVGVGEITNQDLLLITTDSEKVLKRSQAYFEDWSFSLSKIFIGAIEKFYAFQAQQAYPYRYLPLILPFICFPSSEVLIAAASGQNHYGQKPKALKQKLYETDNLATLRDEVFAEKALRHITPESIEKIFSVVPESRWLIQTLAYSSTNPNP
ncbi:MAG: hypothetical protein AAGG51_28155 [Cyanobacteria bacterium P01_G01_bin.54]